MLEEITLLSQFSTLNPMVQRKKGVISRNYVVITRRTVKPRYWKYVTEAASFAHEPRTRRRLSGTLPEKFGTLPEKSGKFRLSSDISDGGPIKFD